MTPSPTQTPTSGASYSICPQFDTDKVHKSNSTVRITVQVCDEHGENLSTFSIHLTAVSLVNSATGEEIAVSAPGHSYADGAFAYNAETQTYRFNLKTKGLKAGTWLLAISIYGDPNLHTINVNVR